MTGTPSNEPGPEDEAKGLLWSVAAPIAAFLVLGLAASNCSGPAEQPNGTDLPTNATAAAAPTSRAVDAEAKPAAPPRSYSVAERSMICRAGIAKVMGRDPATMKATDKGKGITAIQYRRPDDNKLWKSECRLEGDRIIWRGVDSFGNDGPGRWRDLPEDGTLTFALEGKRVTVAETYSDGSVVPETFNFEGVRND